MSLLDYLQRDPECRSLAEGAVHAVAPLLEEPDPEPLLQTLDAWALELAARMPLPWSLHGALDALNHFLFHEQGLHGDRTVFGDPGGALLPRVLAGLSPTRQDVAAMAEGSMCLSCRACTYPKCPFGK